MSTFNYEGNYKCLCGKVFTNSQKFNGHKTHCVTHLKSCGKYENRAKLQAEFKQLGIEQGLKKKQESEDAHAQELTMWVNEQHKCEKCGKVITEKFGSGRFCSRSCANGRPHTEEQKQKISKKLSKIDKITVLYHCPHCNFGITGEFAHRKLCPECNNYLDGRKFNTKISSQVTKQKVKKEKAASKSLNLDTSYKGPALPNIEETHKKAGYFSRKELSYAEQFWKKVLDNNHVEYEHDYKVKNRAGTAVYRLDFLINGNIDFEVDGSEHEEYLYRDIVRYIYLEELGYKQFRVRWVNPINDKNRMIVNCQIDALFEFIGCPRIC